MTYKDNDLISRQAVLASIKNLYPDIPVMDIFGSRRKWLEKYAPYFECENAIEQLPPVNPTKTGHWIEEIDDYGKVIHWHCDKCYEDSGFWDKGGSMKYIALEELEKHIIHDGCDEGCGYIDERDLAAIPTVDLDELRAEIDGIEEGISSYYNDRPWLFKDEVLDIIDKYIESEG